MFRLIVGLFVLSGLFGCSGGGGGSSAPAASPTTPEVDEQSLTSTVRCYKNQSGLDFEFVINNFSNGDKYITCLVAGLSIQVQNSVYYKSTFSGAVSESCLVTSDADSTPSAGYWTFSLASGVRKAVYSDTGSAANGTTITYASGDCITATK